MFRLVVVSCLLILAFGANIRKSKKALRNLRPIFPNGRIVGGEPTPIETVPWQVAIEYDGLQFCGGSIIGPKHVLCSGFCMEGFTAAEISIRIGSSDPQSGGTVIQATKLTSHPKYDSWTIDYDVSVIEVLYNIPSADTSVIKLAEAEPATGAEVLVSGWGALIPDGEIPNILNSMTVPIVDRETCEKAYQDWNPITARMICAGATGKDTCVGDSGGPAVVNPADTDNRAQVGISSWRFGCAQDGFPGVYTNVADVEIRQFIIEQLGD